MTCDSCDLPAAVVLHAMCVHEHYREHPKCEHHARIILAISAAGRLCCDPCFHVSPVHECRISASRKDRAA